MTTRDITLSRQCSFTTSGLLFSCQASCPHQHVSSRSHHPVSAKGLAQSGNKQGKWNKKRSAGELMIKAVYKNSGLSKEAGELSLITLLPGQWMCPLPPAPGLPDCVQLQRGTSAPSLVGCSAEEGRNSPHTPGPQIHMNGPQNTCTPACTKLRGTSTRGPDSAPPSWHGTPRMVEL